VRHREGFSDSNHSSCTPKLLLKGNLLGAPGMSLSRKNSTSRAVAAPTAKLAPWRKRPPFAGEGEANGGPRYGGTYGSSRLSAACDRDDQQ
jgi:hypothetical protein